MAEEACTLGLVNRVLPPDALLDEAMSYAIDITRNCSPASIAAIKEQLYGDVHRTLDEAHDRSIELMQRSFDGPDFREGVTSYLEKRAPAFPPLGEGSRYT